MKLRTALRMTFIAATVACLQEPLCRADAAVPAPSFKIVSRSDWGAKPPNRTLQEHVIDKITVHHQGVYASEKQNAKKRLRSMQAFHQGQNRKFADISYHFIIDRKGTIYEGRSISVPGETKTDYDPKGHLLICLLGDLNKQQPTKEQLESLRAVIQWARNAFHVPADAVKTHRDYAHTDCPGKNLDIASVISE